MQQLSLFLIEQVPNEGARAGAQSTDQASKQQSSLQRLDRTGTNQLGNLTSGHPPQHTASSDPLLLSIWLQLAQSWFPARGDLRHYELKWSPRRQKQTLASVSLERTRVFVARELNYVNLHHWLEPLLYHEMCHAYLRSEYHDRRFYDVERRHPGIKQFDRWIEEGGWMTAIRSDRAKRAHLARRVIKDKVS